MLCLLQVREDELNELDFLLDEGCRVAVQGGSENSYGKVNILLQNYVSRRPVETFSLVSDMAYIVQVGGCARSAHALRCWGSGESRGLLPQGGGLEGSDSGGGL